MVWGGKINIFIYYINIILYYYHICYMYVVKMKKMLKFARHFFNIFKKLIFLFKCKCI